jgi:hypothetical protein
MPTFKDTIMIKDRPYDRAVEVTVTAPEGVNVLNLQELASKARFASVARRFSFPSKPCHTAFW